jgi:hypothetical protein
MSEATTPSVDDFVVTLEFAVKEVNALLNILNTPHQVPAITLVAFINLIQQQAGPQVLKAQDSLAAALNADGVPKDLEARN